MTAEYQYATLSELKSTTGIFNVFGIVTDVKSATKTKGSDHVLNFKITDDSLLDGFAFGVNAFALETTDLPPVAAPGDIVRLHRVKRTTLQGALTGNSHKSGFATVVVPRAPPGAPMTRRAYPSNHTWTEADSARVEVLRTFYASTQPAPVPLRGPQQQTLPLGAPAAAAAVAAPVAVARTGGDPLLASLRSEASRTGMTLLVDCDPNAAGTQFNLIAKLIQVNLAAGVGQSRKLLVYLWDGTGQPSDNEAWGLTAPAPPVGVVLKFAIWDARLFPMFQVNELTDQWVAVHSCIVKKYLEETEVASYKRQTSIAILEPSDARVQQRIAYADSLLAEADADDAAEARESELERDVHKARRAATSERAAAALELARRNNNVLTRVAHGDAPLSTLREVLECEHDVWCFRVRVSIIAVLPAATAHMCRPFCGACNELLPPAPVRLVADERAEHERAQAAALESEREDQLIGGGTSFVVPRLAGQKRPFAGGIDGEQQIDDNALAAVQPPLEPCPRCQQAPSAWRYLVAMRLRDESAALDALLVDDDAVDFFDDVPAGDLRQNNCSRNVLEKKIAALLLPNQKVELCLESFVPASQPAGRVYRIFDTTTLHSAR